MEKPVLKKRSGISPIWILPIIALIIGGGLLYKSYRDAGIDIIVHFADAEGITIGKTRVVYKGITIGMVRGIAINPDVDSVALHIEMKRATKKALVKDLKFWVVKPEISAGRIHGLDTLLSGSYIEVQRGLSKIACREYTGLTESPPIPIDAPGLHIKITADNLGSIQRGTNIYYKNISIGSVQRYKLNEDGEGVVIDAHIKNKFKHLIKTKTRFWNSSGVNFKGGLSGFKFRMESLASLVYGGISLYTPRYQSLSPAAENGRVYQLYEDFDDAEFGLKMTLQLPSGQGIEVDSTQVLHRGFKAGEVTDITFDDEKKIITAHITIDPRAESILREGTRFWVVKPVISVNRVRHLDTLIKGVYIAYEPGEGIYKDRFVAQEAPLTDEIPPRGRHFTLVSENSKSFAISAPILYRDLQVGEITGFDLQADGLKVEGEILIYEKYLHLVQNNSVFWKSGGFKFSAGLGGVNIEAGTLATLLDGGISFTNTEIEGNKRDPAPQAHNFTVHESYQAAIEKVPALQAQGLSIQVTAPDAKNFSVGSPVLYRLMEVGEITGFTLEEGGENVLVDLLIAKKHAHLVQSSSRFHNLSGITIEGGISSGLAIKTGSLKSIVAGGIAFFTPEPGEAAASGQQYPLYSSHKAAQEIDKQPITIKFAEFQGLNDGIKIRYQGLVVGSVKKVDFTKDMNALLCRTLIDKQAAKLFTTDAKIWLVTPEISLAGINNLDTVISGPYITLQPGTGNPATEFTALTKPPVLDSVATGLSIVIEANLLGSLTKNSPLYYRQIKIGKVTGAKLSSTSQKVLIHVNIEPPYDRLVRSNSKFWNSSGINVKAGIFSGIKITTESMEAIIIGGVSLATPEGEAMGTKVSDGHLFPLHDELNESWLKWQPTINLD